MPSGMPKVGLTITLPGGASLRAESLSSRAGSAPRWQPHQSRLIMHHVATDPLLYSAVCAQPQYRRFQSLFPRALCLHDIVTSATDTPQQAVAPETLRRLCATHPRPVGMPLRISLKDQLREAIQQIEHSAAHARALSADHLRALLTPEQRRMMLDVGEVWLPKLRLANERLLAIDAQRARLPIADQLDRTISAVGAI